MSCLAIPYKDIALGLQVYHEHNADAVVAVGGGSGLDAGKCIAMAVASGGAVPLKNFEKGGSLRPFFSYSANSDGPP